MINESYLGRQRHILLDMHVPDWDERFLSRFDPKSFVDMCANSGADAVMVYCNSHVGLCYWPTESGRMHQGLGGVDVVREQVELLHERGIAVCAYYSGPIFNNWAYTEHPEWRIVASTSGKVVSGPAKFANPGSRFGLCCPNHPGCLEFMLRQTEELTVGYPFDAFFFDMVFWPGVCVCESCRQRYRREEGGAEIPETVDWYASEWCRFQSARERWLADAFRQLRERVKSSLDIPVFLNGGNIKFDWQAGVGHDLAALNDLVGGDFEHQSMLATLARFTPTVMQYMKAVSAYGGGASQLMPVEEQKAHALAATTFGGQFMAIDAVAPDGTVNPGTYERLSEVFGAMMPYESFLGGTPIADVGVYWSQQAAVNFLDNEIRLDRIGLKEQPSSHASAMEGAFAALRQAHLAVGVVTRADLEDLDAFSVIVLPNVLRMDPEEVEAFRGYVGRGGRLYASGYTSLVSVDGTRHEDFLLADAFGCHFVGDEDAAVTYLKPAISDASAWIAPVEFVSQGEANVHRPGFGTPATALRIETESETQVIATTTLPYGNGRGSRDDQAWASIHNSPPWQDTRHPAVTRHRFGAGEVIYSTTDIEGSAAQAPPARSLFVGIVRLLLGQERTFDADAHPNIWMTAFHDSEESRMRLCFLNHPSQFPALPVPHIQFRISPPKGAKFTGLHRVPTGEPIQFSLADDGSLDAEIHDIEVFEMLAASYE